MTEPLRMSITPGKTWMPVPRAHAFAPGTSRPERVTLRLGSAPCTRNFTPEMVTLPPDGGSLRNASSMTPHRSTATVPAEGDATVFDEGEALDVAATDGVTVGVGDPSGAHAVRNSATTTHLMLPG